MIVFYGWPENEAAFEEYYERIHVPLCKAIPGLTGIRHAFRPERVETDAPVFCVCELSFDDRAALDSGLASRQGEAAIADVANFTSVPPGAWIVDFR